MNKSPYRISYEQMTVPQRAKHLLSLGVTAKIDIDQKTLTPCFCAYAGGMKLLSAGGHDSESGAIYAGTELLKSKAGV